MESTVNSVRGDSDAIRKDFFESANTNSTKGKDGDVLSQQRQVSDNELTYDEMVRIYKNKRMAQNVIDIPAQDATREGFSVPVENDEDGKIEKSIKNELNRLKIQKTLRDFIAYERLSGDGFINIGVEDSGNPSTEVSKDKIKKVNFLQAFSRDFVEDAEKDLNPLSPTFQEFKEFEIDIGRGNSGSDKTTQIVHPSRILHLQTRSVETEDWGIPILQSVYDALTILDSTAWSLGQIAYAATFKVFKSAGVDVSDLDEWKSLNEFFEGEFNTSTTAVIGEDDELTHEGPGGDLPNLHDLVKFVWEYLAGCARIPKAHLMGQQQGTITGGQYDSVNYYMRIAAMQENFLKPKVRKIVEYIVASSDNDIPNDTKFEIDFNSLWRLDKETDAKIRKRMAEIDQIYLQTKVLDPEEVKSKRFKDDSLSTEQLGDSLDFDVDNEFSDDELKIMNQYIAENMDSVT
ncbi:MAG: DUF1073 domain-containing protein [Halanaerobacter sp.]